MNDGRTILLVGSGPIRIGQAAEFDYSGAQACRALQEEGAEVVLVNSNPATIMTDPEMADRVYVEPITPESIAEVIAAEEPDGVIAGLGGQTGLNVTAELAEQGVLDEYDVEIMGTPLETIYATEDRDRFRARMEELGQPVPRSRTITDLDELDAAVDAVGGLPVIVRTTYTLGGQGSSVVYDREELAERARHGLRLSRNGEVMITESIDGWVELEYEVMRDADDSCVIVCNMENLDPMGIHTGESTVVTPSQVIPDDGHQEMRDAALEVIRDLGIQGGCNIQFAWRDDGTPGGEYRVVEVNPRVSRSSALASKATGYPIARVTAKVALGKRLHEITNEITGETTAAFEPAIDYVVTKVPRWPIDKFPETEFELSTAMKSTGEAMAIGRTFEESLTKALRSSEYDPAVDWATVDDDELRSEYLERPCPERPYAIFEAFARGFGVDEVVEATGIYEWYVERFRRVADARTDAAGGDFEPAASAGLTNREVAAAADTDLGAVERAVPGRSFKQVDTCAGEFAASTPYYYSARDPEYLVDGGGTATQGTEPDGDAATVDDAETDGTEATAESAETTQFVGPAGDELRVDRDAESVVVVGGGPIRIGQGVEFDYCAVHAVQALREQGIDAHVINNNPETVSTDYDTSDGLFFEPLTAEEVADAIEATDADGVMVQFGGQTSVEVGEPLEAELDRRGLDCEIMGTGVEAMDLAEDRDRFNRLLAERGIAQPEGGSATSESEALSLAREIGYPLLVRPSYVLGGRAMEVVHDDDDLREYVGEAVRVSPDKPILVDEFLDGAVELDVDAVADGEDVLLGGIMEHVESAGVHSGDSACVIPPRSLSAATERRVREVVEEIAAALDTVGLLNVQLAIRETDDDGPGEVYVLEANPRSSRTVPFVSKATGVPIAKLAARVMAGESLASIDATEQVPERHSVKEVVLPFDRLPEADPRLGPEMKSTGEVMGTAETFGMAYEKAQRAAGMAAPDEGTAVVEFADVGTEADSERLRTAFADHYELVSPEDVPAALREGTVDFLVSDDRDGLRAAVEEEVPYVSTPEAAEAVLEGLDARGDDLDTQALGDRPRRQVRWGADD
ncbi:carbamoyl-phosphate synthase large subunit [Halobaculum sp. MBLA0147]|uniref:carbamoyl-phosphate synthase large subunit n=1 Tax=Halobaculum sp. MBLA0147 TaxID=3079934 RepID=UPI003525C916